jgi:hypothetical protein
MPVSPIGDLAREDLRIQGYEASEYEYRVAKALDLYKIPYRFQVDVLGGRRVRGGYVIDFIVENPIQTAVEVLGEYWHRDQMKSDDALKMAIIQQMFGRPVIQLWGGELQTQDAANNAVRSKIV